MSTIQDDLVLHLKLDTIQTKIVPDSSKSQKNGTAQGEVKLVYDDSFGACLQFDGTNDQVKVDTETLKSVTNTFTMAAWVIPTATHRIDTQSKSGNAGVTNQKYMFFPVSGRTYGSTQDASAGISVGTNGISVYEHTADYMPPLLTWQKPAGDPALATNDWTHIAVVYQNKTPSLYINGLLVKTGLTSPKSFIHPVGEIGGGAYGYFPGKITNFRVYKRSLSESEILQVMDEDELASSTYRAGHPITFKLFDENQDYVLYISNDPKLEHTLQLELTNTSSQAIQLKDLSGQPASATNHHFELIFRPNTLSRETIAALKEPDQAKRLAKILSETDGKDWDIALSNVTGDELNQFVSLYVLYKKGGEFKQSDKHIITLQNMTAEASIGARGTQVELKLNNLAYVEGPRSPSGDLVQITGSRVQNLHITNHSGRKNIPLHVGFLGSNRILNDGSSNDLKLRITNISKEPLSLEGASFTFSFDVGGEGKDWAIATDAFVNAIKVKVGSGSSFIESDDPTRGEGSSREWRIEKAALPDQLDPNQHLEVSFSNIKTNSPSGHTNLYTDYSVPGYWDGQFVCAIEKAPLLFAQNKVGVGIGVAPENITNTLEVKGGGTFTGGDLVLKATANDPGDIIFQDSASLQKGRIWTNTTSGAGLYLSSGDTAPDISIDKDGKVGIGTPAPKNTLDVKGGVVIGATYAGSETAPNNSLLVEGNVGIGTNNAMSKLTINDQIKSDCYDRMHDLEFKYDDAPLTIFDPTSNGGANPNGTRDILHLVREGARDKYGNKVSFAIGKYTDFAYSSCTQLDIKLTADYFSRHVAVMSLRDDGNVNVTGTVSAQKFVGEGAFVTGMIIMWSGMADQIPSGWALCNGQNNTPDLRNRFIMGTDANTAITTASRSGGSKSHSHQTNTSGSHAHGFSYVGGITSLPLSVSGGQTTMSADGGHSHSTTDADHLPPYFALAFIMKT